MTASKHPALLTKWPPRARVALGLLLVLGSLLGAALMEVLGTSYQPVHLLPADWLEKASQVRVVLASSIAACAVAALAFASAAVRDGDTGARAPAVIGVLFAIGVATIDLRVGLDLLAWDAGAAVHAGT